MKHCPDCGVAVRGDHEFCPLCGSALTTAPVHGSVDALPGDALLFQGIGSRMLDRPWLASLISLALLIIPAGICLIVDIQVNSAPTWSPLVIASLALAWLFISLPGIVFSSGIKPDGLTPARRRKRRVRRFLLVMVLNCIGVWGFLLFVDFRDKAPGILWAADFGGLISVLTLVTILLIFLSFQGPFPGRRVWQLFVWLSLYCIGLDYLITALLIPDGKMGWGFVVAASLIPIAALYGGLVVLWRRNSAARRRLHL